MDDDSGLSADQKEDGYLVTNDEVLCIWEFMLCK